MTSLCPIRRHAVGAAKESLGLSRRRLEVQSTDNGIIKLLPVLRGKGSSRTVRIFNRSERPLSFYLKSPEGQLR